MSNVHLDDKVLIVLKPGFVAAGAPISIAVLNNSSTYVTLSTNDEVDDEIDPPSGVTSVTVHVYDDGAHVMTVTPPGGSQWPHVIGGSYSYGTLDIPANEGDTQDYTISISTTGAQARSQKIIIKRRVVPFAPIS